VGFVVGVGTWALSWCNGVAEAVDVSSFLTSSGFWVGIGGLLTAIGASAYPYYKTWMESRKKSLGERLARLESQQEGLLKLLAAYRIDSRLNRDWIRRVAADHQIALPEGFGTPPTENLSLQDLICGECGGDPRHCPFLVNGAARCLGESEPKPIGPDETFPKLAD
jgi:hypothetical protein